MNKIRRIDIDALKKNIDKFIGYLDEDMIYRIKVVIDNAPTVECQNCEYLKFSERFVELIVGIMTQYGIKSVEELEQRVRGEKK